MPRRWNRTGCRACKPRRSGHPIVKTSVGIRVNLEDLREYLLEGLQSIDREKPLAGTVRDEQLEEPHQDLRITVCEARVESLESGTELCARE